MATSSPARVAASRNNARDHATGPKSASGKARSRQNSLRHGMAGRGVGLLPEDQALVDAKAALWAEELGAEGDLERTCVAEAATAYARMHRVDRTEADRAARRAQAARGRQLAAASRGSVAAEEADDWPDLIAAVEATGKFRLAQLTRARELSGGVEADPRVQQLRDLDARIQRRDPQAVPDLLAWMRRQAGRAAAVAEAGRAEQAAAEAAPRRDGWVDKSKTGELLRRYRGAAARDFHRALARLERVRKLADLPVVEDDETPPNEARSAEITTTCESTTAIPDGSTAATTGTVPTPPEGGPSGGIVADEAPRDEARSPEIGTTYLPIFATSRAHGPAVPSFRAAGPGIPLPEDRRSAAPRGGERGPGGAVSG